MLNQERKYNFYSNMREKFFQKLKFDIYNGTEKLYTTINSQFRAATLSHHHKTKTVRSKYVVKH